MVWIESWISHSRFGFKISSWYLCVIRNSPAAALNFLNFWTGKNYGSCFWKIEKLWWAVWWCLNRPNLVIIATNTIYRSQTNNNTRKENPLITEFLIPDRVFRLSSWNKVPPTVLERKRVWKSFTMTEGAAQNTPINVYSEAKANRLMRTFGSSLAFSCLIAFFDIVITRPAIDFGKEMVGFRSLCYWGSILFVFGAYEV